MLFALLSITLGHAAGVHPKYPTCASLLTADIRTLLAERTGAGPRELASTAAYPAKVSRGGLEEPGPFKHFLNAILIKPPHAEPLILEAEQHFDIAAPSGPHRMRLEIESRTVAWGRDGVWRFTTNDQTLQNLALKPFVETHEGAVRKMLDAGFTEGEIIGSSVVPFDWDIVPGWMMSIVHDSEIRFLFFTADPERYWTAESVLMNFTANQQYLRVGDRLIFKSAPGRIRGWTSEIVGIHADISEWSSNGDDGVARLIANRPDLIEQLLVGGHLLDAFPRGRVLSASAVDVGDEHHKYLLLGQMCPAPKLFEAVVDEAAQQERTQIHFAQPRILKTPDGMRFRAVYAHGQWSVSKMGNGDPYDRILERLAIP